MKQFRSINRQIKRGNIKVEFDSSTHRQVLKRMTRQGKWILM